MHTVTDLTVVGVLARMETALNERGWCQKDFTDDGGHVCLEGAARFVIAGDPETYVAAMSQRQCGLLDEINDVIAQVIGRPPGRPRASSAYVVVDWNDEPGRTVEDVQRVLAVARTLAGGAS